MLRKLLKILHEIGAIGVVGSFAACIVLAAKAPPQPLIAYAAARQQIAVIAQWLLVPSLAIVLISGLLAIAANKAYIDAGWAWLKALLGVGMFEGTLVTISGSARHAAELSALAAAGHPDPVQLAQVLRTESGSLWLLLAVALANIVIAVWRPRLSRRPAILQVERPSA
jgi:uncharacterized membrane protein